MGKITAYLLEKGKRPEELTLEELRSFSELYEEDVLSILDPYAVADRRRAFGGTAKEEVLKKVQTAKREEGMS